MKLYSYFRSSAAYRVRIALNLKGLDYETVPVHLLQGGGQQHQPAYRAINPAGLVPTLAMREVVISQSMAIIEYLEECYPQIALLPDEPAARARVRGIAQNIACDIHPLNNLRVLRYLKHELGVGDDKRDTWYRHWVHIGLVALEEQLASDRLTGRFCHGDQPGLADVFLIPQMYNARRFQYEVDKLPTLQRIEQACLQLDAFKQAAPEQQADANA